LPQLPQLLRSIEVSVVTPPHCVRVRFWQMPRRHTSPCEVSQVCPHDPQFLGSVKKSTQAPLQTSRVSPVQFGSAASGAESGAPRAEERPEAPAGGFVQLGI